MIRLLLALFAVLSLTAPLAAEDTMPPAPFAYRQLDDPSLEAKAQALMHPFTYKCGSIVPENSFERDTVTVTNGSECSEQGVHLCILYWDERNNPGVNTHRRKYRFVSSDVQ